MALPESTSIPLGEDVAPARGARAAGSSHGSHPRVSASPGGAAPGPCVVSPEEVAQSSGTGARSPPR